jgi:hypothetical protein
MLRDGAFAVRRMHGLWIFRFAQETSSSRLLYDKRSVISKYTFLFMKFDLNLNSFRLPVCLT